MCGFCEKGKVPSLKSDNMNLEIYLNDNYLVVETHDGNDIYDSDVEINFCPVCGRQLKETLVNEEQLLGC